MKTNKPYWQLKEKIIANQYPKEYGFYFNGITIFTICQWSKNQFALPPHIFGRQRNGKPFLKRKLSVAKSICEKWLLEFCQNYIEQA